MKCFNPILIYYDLDRKKYSFKMPDRYNHDDSIFVPCGKCASCRNEWRTQLAQRVRYELMNYNYNERCFLTITVNEENLYKVFPGRSVCHTEFQKFIKKLRSYLDYHKIPHKPLKYFMCAEYGEKEGHRPHYHVILLGWKPEDMKAVTTRKTKKGYIPYKSKFLEDLWGYGFVDVGDVTEHTAPYMVKYMVKYSEIPQNNRKIKEVLSVKCKNIWYDEGFGKKFVFEDLVIEDIGFNFDGIPVRKPYIVYPKKIMGLDYFLENYKQILRLGYILDSNGHKHGIPRSFKKWIENQCTDSSILELYNDYLTKVQFMQEEELLYLKSLGLNDSWSRLEYYREQGKIKQEIYESFKNKNR